MPVWAFQATAGAKLDEGEGGAGKGGQENENAGESAAGFDEQRPPGNAEAEKDQTAKERREPEGTGDGTERSQGSEGPASLERAKNVPRPVVRLQEAPRLARALWRGVDGIVKPKKGPGAATLNLTGYEYRYRVGPEDEKWSKWRFTHRSRSRWLEDLRRGQKVTFQVRTLWHGTLGETFYSKSQEVTGRARSGSGERSDSCTAQPGRHPGVAYATGGERTYVEMTTNLCLGSLLVEQEDISLKVPGPDLKISRTYNSSLAYQGGLLGFGWTSSLEKSVTELPTGDVLYEDGQGGAFIFTESGGTYERPAGLYLTLEKLIDQSFTLTDRQNIVETYNAESRLVSIADPDGNATAITWMGDRPVQVTDSAGRDTNLAYNGWGLLETITDPEGRVVTLGYDQGDLRSASHPGDSDHPQRTTQFAYDPNHRLTRTGTPELVARGDSVSDSDCGLLPGEAVILYDDQERVASITNERHIIDDANQVELCGQPIGDSTTYTYEFDELKCPDPVCVTDPREHVESYVLDDEGRPSRVIDAEHRPIYFTYDQDSNLTEMIEFRGTRQLKTQLAYDSRGNLTSLKEPGHERPTRFGYDSRDNLAWKQMPGARLASAGHRGGSKRAPDEHVAARDATSVTEETACSHTAGGAAFSADAEKVESFYYTYTPTDHLKTLTTPGCSTWRFEYDSAGNRTAVVDPEGRRTAYGFLADGRLESLAAAWDTDQTYLYDYGIPSQGNARRLDPADPSGNGCRVLYILSPARQLTYVHVYGSSYQNPCTSQWFYGDYGATYNENGSLKESCSGLPSSQWMYDDWNHVENIWEANGTAGSSTSASYYDFAYIEPCFPWVDVEIRSYTTANQVDQGTYNKIEDRDGTQWGEDYETAYWAADSSIKDVKTLDGEVIVQHLTHDEQDNITEIEHPVGEGNWVNQTSQFDDANRETSRRIEKEGQAPWLDQSLTYDEGDNPTSVTEDGTTTTYNYDAQGQVTSSTQDGERTEWSYDDAGNRLTEELPDGEVRTYFYDEGGRLERVECGEETCIEIQYNEFGQPTEVTDLLAYPPGLWQYYWDFLGRLIEVGRPDGRWVTQLAYGDQENALKAKEGIAHWDEYHYDANGRLVVTKEQNMEIEDVYNYDGQGNLISTGKYEYGEQPETYYYNRDALGNVVGLHDDFVLQNTYRYDPWGNLVDIPERVSVASPPGVASDGRFGLEDVFVRGEKGKLWCRHDQDGLWGFWEDLGKPAADVTLASAPGAAYVDGSVRVDVFVEGSDGELWSISRYGGDWGSWQSLGRPAGDVTLASALGVAHKYTGEIDVLVKGSDGQMWLRSYWNGQWGPWGSLGQPAAEVSLDSAPGVASKGTGVLDVFVKGTDGNMWIRSYWSGQWGGWGNLGQPAAEVSLDSAPGVASKEEGELDVFVKGTDEKIWSRSYTGGQWGDWTDFGQPAEEVSIDSTPAVTSPEERRLGVFIKDGEGKIWNKNYVFSGWGYWGRLPVDTGPVNNPWRFKGAWWDEDIQLYYIGDRWYNPRIGRFISPPILPDPYEDQEMVYDVANPYVFEGNNPLKNRGKSGWTIPKQVRRQGLGYFQKPNRFRKERMPQYWELKRRIALGSPSRPEGMR